MVAKETGVTRSQSKAGIYMNSKKAGNHENGGSSPHELAVKAAAAQKMAEAARKHFKMLKSEYKQARKAYKQAKKASKRARKEEKAAREFVIAKHAAERRSKPTKGVRRAHPAQRKTHTATTVSLPSATTASVASGGP
jgi:hypothetical protein